MPHVTSRVAARHAPSHSMAMKYAKRLSFARCHQPPSSVSMNVRSASENPTGAGLCLSFNRVNGVNDASLHGHTRRSAVPRFRPPSPLFVDQGAFPAGKDRALLGWAADAFGGPKVRFRNSANLPGLQLADFAAFIINRRQWIFRTRQAGRSISQEEQMIPSASAALNVLNFTPKIIPFAVFGRAESRLSADRVAKGLAPQPLSNK